jgi:hypothetical protein
MVLRFQVSQLSSCGLVELALAVQRATWPLQAYVLLTVAQLVKIFPTFYETRRFVARYVSSSPHTRVDTFSTVVVPLLARGNEFLMTLDYLLATPESRLGKKVCC